MLSGGVDSAVAALLLRDRGYQVTGVFMKNWSPKTWQSLTDCPWEQDQADAEAVAKKLGIEFRSVNFETEYQEVVVKYFLNEYRAGRTPNPDIMCNKEIKFGAFYRWAIAQRANYVASGHYAQIKTKHDQVLLARGVDEQKDQSYFLWAVPPNILRQTLFPVGELHKDGVRRLAQQAQLPVATKKDSQGICFIGHLNVGHWLRSELGVKRGHVILSDGSIVGEHDGVHLYTIGQRHGFSIDQPATLSRVLKTDKGELPMLYVIHKKIDINELVVDNQPPVCGDIFTVEQVVWHDQQLGERVSNGELIELHCQVRYRQSAVLVEVAPLEGIDHTNQVAVRPLEQITAVTEGQFAVFYHDDLVVGGGVIKVGT